MIKWRKRRWLLLCVFLFSIFMGIGLAFCESFDSTFAWLHGDNVLIYPKRVDLGKRQPGTKLIVTFKMKNLAKRDISVVGEKSSCSCAFSDQIPITAKPGETIDLNVNVILPKQDSSYDQIITFLVAEPDRLAMYPVRVVTTITSVEPK